MTWPTPPPTAGAPVWGAVRRGCGLGLLVSAVGQRVRAVPGGAGRARNRVAGLAVDGLPHDDSPRAHAGVDQRQHAEALHLARCPVRHRQRANFSRGWYMLFGNLPPTFDVGTSFLLYRLRYGGARVAAADTVVASVTQNTDRLPEGQRARGAAAFAAASGGRGGPDRRRCDTGGRAPRERRRIAMARQRGHNMASFRRPWHRRRQRAAGANNF